MNQRTVTSNLKYRAPLLLTTTTKKCMNCWKIHLTAFSHGNYLDVALYSPVWQEAAGFRTWLWLTSTIWVVPPSFKKEIRKKEEPSTTYGSKTSRVMYSFGIRGSWCENTFCSPTSHIRIFLLGFWFRELPTTWNSITPLRSSSLAASSRAECADSKLVCRRQEKVTQNFSLKTIGMGHLHASLICSNKIHICGFSGTQTTHTSYKNKMEKEGKAFWEIRV